MIKKIIIVPYAAYFRLNLNIFNLFKMLKDAKPKIIKEKLKKEYPNITFIIDTDFKDGVYLLRHKADIYLIPDNLKNEINLDILGKDKCYFINQEDYRSSNIEMIKKFIDCLIQTSNL